MSHGPRLDVWKFTNGLWTWLCWECEGTGSGSDHPTHAEALAAALDHCHKKEAS